MMATSAQRPKKQHFLPQLLLRGFASRVDGENAWAFVFRRGGACKGVETRAEEIGHARFFYGDPSESDLEFRIGDLETEIGGVFLRLRSGQTTADDLRALPVFVNHFAARTKNLRDGATEAGKATLEIAMRRLCEGKDRKLLKNECRKAIRKKLDESGVAALVNRLPPFRRKLIMRVAEKQLDDYISSERFKDDTSELFQQFQRFIDMKTIVAGAQRKALAKIVEETKVPERLRSFNWNVVRCASPPCILGDAVVLGRGSSDSSFTSVWRASKPELICLPIASTTVVVGYATASSPDIDFDELNRASASSSRDFFVSSCCSTRELEYASLIGTNAAVVSDEELQRFSDEK
jgi:hypothetical protein